MTRRVKLLLGIAVGVVVAAVTAVTVFVVANYDRGNRTARPPMAAVVQEMIVCADHVILYFRTDEEMTVAVAELRKDPQVGSVKGETKAEAYERFKEIFTDQPELVELADPETMPASAEVGPTGDVDAERLAGRLRDEFHESDDVSVLPCRLG
jgi:cell division protein FtsX